MPAVAKERERAERASNVCMSDLGHVERPINQLRADTRFSAATGKHWAHQFERHLFPTQLTMYFGNTLARHEPLKGHCQATTRQGGM